MRKTFLVLCAGLVLSLGAFAQNDLTAPVKAMLNGFNSGDMKAVTDQYASGGITIIDEVPPFHWSGAKAHDEWLAALQSYDKANGVSDAKVNLGSIVRTESHGDSGYVVAAVTYPFQQKGKSMTESAHMTFALHKEGGAWKIAGWVWSGSEPHEAKAAK